MPKRPQPKKPRRATEEKITRDEFIENLTKVSRPNAVLAWPRMKNVESVPRGQDSSTTED